MTRWKNMKNMEETRACVRVAAYESSPGRSVVSAMAPLAALARRGRTLRQRMRSCFRSRSAGC